MARAGYIVKNGSKTVASAGTAVRLVADTTWTHSVEIVAESDNAGNIYIGDSTVDSTVVPRAAGDSVTISGPLVNGHQELIDMNKIWIDAGTTGDGVLFSYIASANDET